MAGLKVGDSLPSFELQDQDGQLVTSQSLHAAGPLVIYFYPKDDTPICTRESCYFRDDHSEFEAAGAKVVGISVDSAKSHKSFAGKFQLPFSLLADTENAVRKQFGVPKVLGLLAGRSTYVFDKEGILRHCVHSGFRARKHVDEALRIVQDLAK